MDLFEAIHTQRAIRSFKSDPVPDAVIRRVLDAAIHAPSGGNRQPWIFMVLKDQQVKRSVGQLYKQGWDASYNVRLTVDPDPSLSRVYRSSQHLAMTIGEAPVLILACIHHDGSVSTMTRGASIYPAVQNMMLAARALGLGTVITTLHKFFEDEVKELLRIPDHVETAALIPLGYPTEGVQFGGSRRRPVEEVTYTNLWGNRG